MLFLFRIRKCRVDKGSFLPPPPTEPLVRISRKRLLVVADSLRDCRFDYSRLGEWISLQQFLEPPPRHPAFLRPTA